jgi:hypothetical protein
VSQFLSGLFFASSAAVALFFIRFWQRTRDRLFMTLALAFVLLALERVVLEFVSASGESHHFIYLLRLAAFVLIIGGILDKNRAR